MGDFIGELLNAVEIRSRFVPFFGAGTSVASGIPAIRSLEHYLAFCIRRRLASDGDVTPTWPSIQDCPPGEKNRFERVLLATKGIANFAVDSKEDADMASLLLKKHNPSLLQAAYGALSDWRDSLDFLSRLKEEMSPISPKLKLGAPDSAIRDS